MTDASTPATTAAPPDDDDRDPVSFGLALAAAAVLGLAAILTAWGSFQASRASGAVEQNYNDQQAMIASANDIYAQSDQERQLEQQFFLTFAINAAQGNDDAVAYLTATMSDELSAAVTWWFEQPDETSPPTPFVQDNPEYANLPSQVLLDEGNVAMDDAAASRLAAEEAGKLGDRYGLANVFFAIVLFLAGIATLLKRTSIQVGILGLGVVTLVVGAVIIVSTPGWSSIG
jgi:hypothetical protein